VGSFWSGVAHLLTSLDQLGFLLGLAIWTSFHDRRFDAGVIAVASGTVLAGVGAGLGLAGAGQTDLAAAAAALMVAVGLAGAMRLRGGAPVLLGLATLGGIAAGAASVEAASGLSLALFSLGAAVATASVLSYGLLATRRLDAEWGSVARRAGASWIAAIGLIILAFSLVHHGVPV
jgi:hydrogenase/urease accessory protein HupE